LSLNRAGSFRRLKEELTRYNIGIAALQEIRWKGSEIMDSKDYTIVCIVGLTVKYATAASFQFFSHYSLNILLFDAIYT
jgi:hypothetical protein